MKFLLKFSLLFLLIIVGRFVKQPRPVALTQREAVQQEGKLYVQQVSHQSQTMRQTPGTPPVLATNEVFSIE